MNCRFRTKTGGMICSDQNSNCAKKKTCWRLKKVSCLLWWTTSMNMQEVILEVDGRFSLIPARQISKLVVDVLDRTCHCPIWKTICSTYVLVERMNRTTREQQAPSHQRRPPRQNCTTQKSQKSNGRMGQISFVWGITTQVPVTTVSKHRSFQLCFSCCTASVNSKLMWNKVRLLYICSIDD